MGKKKNIKNLGPKRKRMKRSQRLQNAVEWLKKYQGENIVKGYAKWYGVDTICAMTELEMLGMKFSEEKKAQLHQGQADRARQKQIQKLKRKSKEAFKEDDYDSDETFAYIAGYTEGGIPFGITHEEMAEFELQKSELAVSTFYDSHHDPMVEDYGDWFSDSFDWKDYFGDFQPDNEQDKLINELNKLDILSQIQNNHQKEHMESIEIAQLIIPIRKEELLRWKERDKSIVPEFALNWKGDGVRNGYGFGEWIAEKYFRILCDK